jgi:hypothetical protein
VIRRPGGGRSVRFGAAGTTAEPGPLAAWHARRRQLLAGATKSQAKASEEVIASAQQVRKRMLKLMEHYFGDDEAFGPTVAAIRSGTGYQDLANDLQGLADLFDRPRVKAAVERDPVYYQPGDAQTARQHAGAILTELGLNAAGEAQQWTDLAQRTWTLLSTSYDEVQAAGQFLFRHDEDVRESYPSLISAVRNPPKKGPESGGGSGEGPSPG